MRIEITRCDWLRGKPWHVDINGITIMLTDDEPTPAQIEEAKRVYEMQADKRN
jgi:hypothetical protein